MTEEEWLVSTDLRHMALHLETLGLREGVVTLRKCRLLLIAGCRSTSEQLKLRGVDIYDLGERYADGVASEEEARDTRRVLQQLMNPFRPSLLPLVELAIDGSRPAHECVTDCFRRVARNTVVSHSVLTVLLCDIFGNPYRRKRCEKSWLTSDVLALARGIYDERAFDRMPILADALQDAGCANEDVLSHCRDPHTAHVRGCWVVGLLLGKE